MKFDFFKNTIKLFFKKSKITALNCLSLYDRRHIYAICLGDSHIKIFSKIDRDRSIPGMYFETIAVPGATARGSINPNSRTDALQTFKRRIESAKPWQYLFFQLGEVDCGFLIWYCAQKYKIPIRDALETSILNYSNFLEWVRTRNLHNIYILSVPLPTISDGVEWGEVANARRGVQASQLERTALTLEYNDRLKQECEKRGFSFIDITSEQLNPETQIVDPRFVNSDILDHHLNPIAYSESIVETLRFVIELPF
ncbi:SGNH/GDSL hydrolase family protein [Oxynema sp. CENA135]|uniref:SGNH/GDSL hydrolase family protein n=1 Tax=Oxynema sp. CENA135 TaxID=984206 RepID=UPI00190B86ED|nr:SGNH/GDSL hydrolase family protein [Oxynema sp. CENA135]MBK4728717.1 SGNH/GDSL hydrolase family protein [Oxynema sp. CENA135]